MKKKSSFYHFLFLALMPAVAFSVNGQPQFIQVASRANSYCNSTCTQLDIPALNENTVAIVFASPIVEGGVNLNPHPIGVHFINHKWSIINLDQTSMPAGSKFSVQYFSTPDPAYQFVHTVSMDNLKQNNTRSYIDHAGINDNPDAKIQFIVTGIRSGFNVVNLAIQYDADAGKWYLSNGNKPVDINTAVNIVIGKNEKPNERVSTTAAATAVNQPAGFGPVTDMLISIEGTVQGKFKGESTRVGQANKSELTSFNFEVSTPVDISSGNATGKPIRQPITVTKILGAASLQLYKALLTNETLKSVTIEFYSAGRTGAIELSNTIKLTNAKIISFKQNIITYDVNLIKRGLVEEIKFSYSKIEMTDALGLIITDDRTQN